MRNVPEADALLVMVHRQTDFSAGLFMCTRFQGVKSWREGGNFNLLNGPLVCVFSISACCSMVQDYVNYFRIMVTLKMVTLTYMVKYFKTFYRHFWIVLVVHFPTMNVDSTVHCDF